MSLCFAKCDKCPMHDKTPIEAEHHENDEVVILGDFPGGHEVLEGRPFVGPSGMELQAALDAIGISRTRCQINNVLACQPPDNRLDIFLLKLSRSNKKRKREGKEVKPTPHECCAPRLNKDLEGFKNILCLGTEAARALHGRHVSGMAIRGACENIDMPWGEVKVAYTLHPSFVLHSPKWAPVFRSDIAKGFRFFDGNLKWEEPEISLPQAPHEIKKALKKLRDDGLPIAYDVETDAKNPLTARLRCVGFSNTKRAVVVPFRSIDGSAWPEVEEIAQLTKEFLMNPPGPIIGHNAGVYDRLVCETQLGITPPLRADTMLLHLLVDNEMPHNLGFITSVYTDFTEAWKANHTALDAKSDEELHIYCAKDCCVTARIATPLAQRVKERRQDHLLLTEHQLQTIGCDMQKIGMRVDVDRLRQHGDEFQTKLEKHKQELRSLAPENFNPNSTLQLRKILFDDWELPPVKYNEKTGDPSTDDDTLRRMLTEYGLDEEKRVFVQSIRLIRRYTKLLSTYVRPLLGGLILSDGRVHPSYNRLPATGRYSSSEPNAQNIPFFLRDIFVPEDGHIFVGADMDQLELRLIAEEANAERLLAVINSGLDPHNETMEIVYGKEIWALDGAPKERTKKGKGTFKATRGVTKNVRYAWQYAASIPKIWEQVVSVENEEGKLIYAHMTKDDIRDVVKGLRKADPEIPKWWNLIRNRYRREGFIADSIWQRRRDFRDEEKLNELVNHPIQSGGASIVHEAMLELVLGISSKGTVSIQNTDASSFSGGALPFNFEARTGLVNQCHDSLLFEVPEEDGEKVAKTLQAAMTRRRRSGARLTYTAEAEVAQSWLEA